MADSPVFEWTADELEKATTFDRLQARGTVRLALKKAGIESAAVTTEQMVGILERIMPHELKTRKIENADQVCQALARAIRTAGLRDGRDGQEAPEDAFRRMFTGI